MDTTLRQFNGDVNTKEELLSFITEYINQTAIDRMYKKEDVSHIADAKSLIDGAFEELENIYGIKNKQKEVANQAR